MALARLGNGDEAVEIFHMLNPANHARTPEAVAVYQTEPYALAGDIVARGPYTGRGGWTWYTGAAGWMYQVGLGSILGLRPHGQTFAVDPCVAASWPSYRITWQYRSTRYEISVTNPLRRARGIAAAEIDGRAVDAMAIPLLDDGGVHLVSVTMGDSPTQTPEPPRTASGVAGVTALV
jgi:cyclic beta-1,2-glucan synthetase